MIRQNEKQVPLRKTSKAKGFGDTHTMLDKIAQIGELSLGGCVPHPTFATLSQSMFSGDRAKMLDHEGPATGIIQYYDAPPRVVA